MGHASHLPHKAVVLDADEIATFVVDTRSDSARSGGGPFY